VTAAGAPAATLLALVAGGCGLAGAAPWPTRPPAWIHRTGTITDPRLPESSGAARGRVNPDLVWTHNDSRNDPVLYAIDTAGTVRAAVRVAGARNVDWEAMAAAPCGDDECLYVGDVGDNGGRRPSVTIYRVVEPLVGPAAEGVADGWSVPVRDSLVLRLEGGPRDVESLAVTRAGDVVLVARGWFGRPGVYQAGSGAWAAGRATARRTGTLPVATGMLAHRLLTDAALSPDGRLLAVRSYREVFLFRVEGRAPALRFQPLVACSVRGYEPQGEGVTWWDGTTLLLTSERGRRDAAAPVHRLRCDPS
jgi:hypothetical protein